jgi:hypothetical protein
MVLLGDTPPDFVAELSRQDAQFAMQRWRI